MILDIQAQEKLKYLLTELAGKNADKLMDALTDKNVDMKDFMKKANQMAGIQVPTDPRSEKYKEISMYSRMDVAKMLKEKYPQHMTVTFENVNIENLKQYVKYGYIGMDLSVSINDSPISQDNILDIKKKLMPDEEGYKVWPDDVYKDSELNEWIEDTLEQSNIPDIFRKDALSTHLVEQHPDFMNAKLWMDGEDENLTDNMTVEGRPFDEVIKIVEQNPEMTTVELKSHLLELNKKDTVKARRQEAETRITGLVLAENFKGQIVRCKIDGEQQMFHPLTKEQSYELSLLTDKNERKAFLIDILGDVYKDKLYLNNQKDNRLKL